MSRLDILPGPSVLRMSGMWAYFGGSTPKALKSSRCFEVLERWSSPRITWVIFISMSSTTLTKWKTGSPLERKITKSRSSTRAT